MALLPRHGRINCQKCFSETTAAWGRAVFEQDGWRLEHNPCAWGAQNPNVLVLGFSKGNNQTDVIESSPFNEVPFRGMRTNLTRILQRLDLLGLSEEVDARIGAAEQNYAFGSVIRCSIAKDGKKAGDVINAATMDHVAQRVISNCTSTFLRELPPRLRTIVLLSNDDDYVEACFVLMKALHPDIRRINEMAYGNDRITWVHVIHPSGSSGRHIKDWLDSEGGRQAEKRELVLAALAQGQSVTVSVSGASPTCASEILEQAYPTGPEKTKAGDDGEHERYSRCFCFVLQGGAVLYPVRMRNRDTGRFAFRLSKGGKGGNTKDLGIEVENEDQMTKLALEQGYAIRMSSLDGRTTGLYRSNKRSVREVRVLGVNGGRLK